MKVTLDLTDLVAKGQLTKEEADRLAKLGAADTGALGSNILLSFGTVAVTLGAAFFVPTPEAAIVLGTILFAVGLALLVSKATKWTLFAQTCSTIGALAIVGGVSVMSGGNMYVNYALAAGLAIGAGVAASGLLAALSVLQLSVALGSGTEYWHASYGLWVERPALSIAALAVVAVGLLLVSMRVPSMYERVCLIASRTAVLMINLAFLVGSLFGDQMFGWPAAWFTIAWAVLLIGVGIWGIYANRRWVVNAAAVFGAIHFYTQWFEYLGPNPFSVFGGGVLLIVFGLLLRWINTRVNKPALATA